MNFSSKFICATKEYSDYNKNVPAPYIRKSFIVKKDVKNAEILITGLGFYKLFINGSEITKGFLAPYISNPDDIVYYDKYNISKNLTEGENVIGIILGNGFQNCYGGYVWDFEKAVFRGAPKTALSITMEYEDDCIETIESDETFKTMPSPIRNDDIRLGEIYDARHEIDNWNLPGFDDSKWNNVILAERIHGIQKLCGADPILPRKELAPVSIWKEDDSYIYDFGVNLSGVCRLTICGHVGQKVEFLHGERLFNGKFDIKNLIFLRKEYENLPQYTQKDTYICKGTGCETYTPSFTYHGFRYVKVTGITEEQATDKLLTFIVFNSDLKDRGSFSCSDNILNRLQEMTRASILSNFHYFPTDCPHREKNGWTADAALSSEAALLNFEPERSYAEWLHNIRLSMNEKGALPGIIPTSGWGFAWGNGPAWDSVLVELTYNVYLHRGDKQIIEDNASALLRYIHYLTTRTRPDGLIAIGLGDWVSPPEAKNRSPLEFTDTVMSIDICTKSAFLFGVVGMNAQKEFALTIADSFRKAARELLIDFNTMKAKGDCQTSQAMAIYYGLFTEEEKESAFKVLLDIIEEDEKRIMTGVLGGRILFRLLSDFNEYDIAYDILTNPNKPSYRDWVDIGMTTLGESFIDKTAEYTDSLNHHFWGDISAWFIKYLGGINVNPNRDNVNEVNISPCFVSKLDYVNTTHITPSGEVKVSWRRDKDTIVLNIITQNEMHGLIKLRGNYAFADNSNTKPLESGEYVVALK